MMLKTGRLPTFLAVETPELDPTLFTSKAMKWSETAWLMDLGVCRRYWQSQAACRGVQPQDLLLALLQRVVGDSGFSGALADTPWKAVLLLEHMRQRSLAGLISQGEQFGGRLYQQVSWPSWMASASRYGTHCKSLKLPRYNEPIFRRQLKHLLDAAKRLSQPRPADLAAATAPSIKRRFGAHVALLWDWTFAPNKAAEGAQLALFPDDEEPCDREFPWVSWSPPQKPSVTRHLEYSVWQWDQIEPLLVEDFDRLCQAEGWNGGESVVHLSWNLVLDDTSVLPVEVRFRHPHRLHSELGIHRTATLQASYAFCGTFRPQQDSEDEVCPSQPIVGWTMTVEARMSSLSVLQDLFGDPTGDPTAAGHMRLENQLPVAVQRFSLAGDWVPEASFRSATMPADQMTAWGPWLALARRRPLYIYKEPLSLDDRLRRTSFLERTAASWLGTGGLHERDYFILEDYRDKWRWGYQDPAGNWCIHGVFG